MWKKILWVQCILVLHNPLPVTVGNRTDIWCTYSRALWRVGITGTYILFRKSKFNVLKDSLCYINVDFYSGDHFISYKHTLLVLSPRKCLLSKSLIWLLLITCHKDSTWIIWQTSIASIERIHFLKLLQSKALTGTLVMESVFQWSTSNAFFLPLCWKSARGKQVPAAISC